MENDKMENEKTNTSEQILKGIQRVLKHITELTGLAYQVDLVDMANAWKKTANSNGVADEEMFERTKYYYKNVTPSHLITYVEFMTVTSSQRIENVESEEEIAGMKVGFANQL